MKYNMSKKEFIIYLQKQISIATYTTEREVSIIALTLIRSFETSCFLCDTLIGSLPTLNKRDTEKKLSKKSLKIFISS